MTEKELEMIKEALYEAELIRIKQIEAMPQVEFNPTQEYKDKIDEIRAKIADGSISRMSLKRRIIVAVAATLIIALFATACAFRRELKGFFVDLFDSFAAVSNDHEYNKDFKVHKLSWIPEDYIESYLDNTTKFSKIVYSYAENAEKHIKFNQVIISDATTTFDIESKDYSTVTINEMEIYYFEKGTYKYLFWYSEEYIFYLSCPSEIVWEDIEKMITSIYCEE